MGTPSADQLSTKPFANCLVGKCPTDWAHTSVDQLSTDMVDYTHHGFWPPADVLEGPLGHQIADEALNTIGARGLLAF